MSRLFRDASWLMGDATDGYGTWPIPDPLDDRISRLIQAWMQLPSELRENEAASITDEQAGVLRAYSERIASWAVRTKDAKLLVFGLLAIGIDGGSVDWREDILLLSLHHDAAQKVGVAPEIVFEEAARLLPTSVEDALMAFLKRSPDDQSLESMGYKEAADRDGFRYQRTW